MPPKIWTAEIFLSNLSPEGREKVRDFHRHAHRVYGTKRKGFEELFVLQTDSQFVVYGVGDTPDPLLNFFLQDPTIYEHVHFYKSTEASINHLFATATGLCSDIKGSVKVGDDIAEALLLGLSSGGLGLVLDSVVRQSLRSSRKIRKATGIDGLTEVVVTAGLDKVLNECEAASELTFLLVGSGEVCRRSLQYLKQQGAQNVIVCSENEDLTKEVGLDFAVKAVDFDLLDTYVQFADVIVSEHPVGNMVTVPTRSEPTQRHHRKIFLDFTSGASVNDTLRSHPLLKIYTVDDINSFPTTTANVYHALEEAWKMVEVEAAMAVSSLNMFSSAPWLAWCWPGIARKGEHEISLLQHRKVGKKGMERLHFLNDALMIKRGVVPVRESVVSDTRGGAAHAIPDNVNQMEGLVQAYSSHFN